MHRFNVLARWIDLDHEDALAENALRSGETLLCSLWEVPPSATSERFALMGEAVEALTIALKRFTAKE